MSNFPCLLPKYLEVIYFIHVQVTNKDKIPSQICIPWILKVARVDPISEIKFVLMHITSFVFNGCYSLQIDPYFITAGKEKAW